MYFIERHLVQSYREKGYLFYFKRFIDDIIGIWNGNLESLKCFLSEYDNLENGINITHVISFDRLSATRRLLLKVSLFVTARVIQPLNLSML